MAYRQALESVLKPSKQPNKDTGNNTDNGMKIEGLLLISGGKTAVVFEFEEQILHKMALLVCMPVSISGMLCVDAAGNNHNPASFFHPADKLATVIPLVGQNQLAVWTFVVKPPLLRPVSSWYPLF